MAPCVESFRIQGLVSNASLGLEKKGSEIDGRRGFSGLRGKAAEFRAYLELPKPGFLYIIYSV